MFPVQIFISFRCIQIHLFRSIPANIMPFQVPVLRIHYLLVWIRIRVSKTLTNLRDPAIFVIVLQDTKKNNFLTQFFLLITF